MKIVKAYMIGKTMCLQFETGELTRISPDTWPDQPVIDEFLAVANGGTVVESHIDESILWIKVQKGIAIQNLFVRYGTRIDGYESLEILNKQMQASTSLK
jgi:hypothetical protein